MKTSPLAVTSGPPMPGMPQSSQNGQGARPRVVPNGTRQATSPLARSIAISSLQGGCVHGMPQDETNTLWSSAVGRAELREEDLVGRVRRGVPDTSSRGTRRCTIAACVWLRTSRSRPGSHAALPQFMPPATPGN